MGTRCRIKKASSWLSSTKDCPPSAAGGAAPWPLGVKGAGQTDTACPQRNWGATQPGVNLFPGPRPNSHRSADLGQRDDASRPAGPPVPDDAVSPTVPSSNAGLGRRQLGPSSSPDAARGFSPSWRTDAARGLAPFPGRQGSSGAFATRWQALYGYIFFLISSRSASSLSCFCSSASR